MRRGIVFETYGGGWRGEVEKKFVHIATSKPKRTPNAGSFVARIADAVKELPTN